MHRVFEGYAHTLVHTHADTATAAHIPLRQKLSRMRLLSGEEEENSICERM